MNSHDLTPEVRLAHLKAILNRVDQTNDMIEWSIDGVCPSCLNDSEIGHEDDCELKKTIDMVKLALHSY